MYEFLERPSQLIIKFWKGEATPEEETELQDWIERSDENQALLDKYKDENWVRDEVKAFSEIDVDDAQQKIWARINAYEETKTPPVMPIKGRRITIKNIAIAAAAIGIVITGMWWWNSQKNKLSNTTTQTASRALNQPGSDKATLTLPDGTSYVLQEQAEGLFATANDLRFYKDNSLLRCEKITLPKNSKPVFNYSLTVPRGGQYKVDLPDGSRVWLNAASSLTFSSNDNGNRRVALRGEGFFRVHADPSRPFIVNADNSDFEATGTQFNVRAYNNEGITKASLIEGRLKAVTGSGIKRILPGQSALITPKKDVLVSNEPDIESVVAWTKGDFKFHNESATTAILQLARWYNMQTVFIDTPVTFITYRDSRSRPIDTIIYNINEVNRNSMRIDIKKDTLVIRSK